MQEIQQLAIQESRNSLIAFSIVIDRDYEVNWHHREIAKALEKIERGEIKLLILEVPPRHGKSQLSSILFPAWFLGRNPEKEIITASYSSELAKDFGSKTRDVVNDQQYKIIFNGISLKEDSKAKNKWHTNKGGSYTSVGVGGSITGRGANVLIIDDPIKNREEAESSLYRDKVWNWYTSTAHTRLEKGGAEIIIMTRWHTDDLVGRIIENAEEIGREYTRITFPAIAENDDNFRKEGEPLWEDKYNTNDLDEVKKIIGPYDWSSLYQQSPITTANQVFHKDWFNYYDENEYNERDTTFLLYTTVDLALDGERADDTAIITIAKRKDRPEIFLVDVHNGRFDPGTTIEYLFMLKAKYEHRWVRCGIETVAYQKAFMYFIQEEMKKRGTYFDVVELKAKGAKELRIQGLVPLIKSGVLKFSKGEFDLEKQLLEFPMGKKDDIIDALAYINQVTQNTSNQVMSRQYLPPTGGFMKR